MKKNWSVSGPFSVPFRVLVMSGLFKGQSTKFYTVVGNMT